MKETTLEDVKKWILANSNDREAMDELNRLTYVFTSKYAERQSVGGATGNRYQN